MKIAIVGTGVSGLVSAHLLHSQHDVTLFEAADWVGGHTHTVDVTLNGRTSAVDTGFIVCNRKTYPLFMRLLEELGLTPQHSDMSFSACSEAEDVEYNGTSLSSLFAQRRNIVRPAFLRMVRDILRFYREAGELLKLDNDDMTLGRYLSERRYSREFIDWHIVPMAAAVWSAKPQGILDFPARYLVQFFANHGFLQVEDRPQWLVVPGGSREYVRRLIRPFEDRILLQTPVLAARRAHSGVELQTRRGTERFDRVIFATHADTTLRILNDATREEREVLGAFEYQDNDTVLHTDAALMPQRKRAWAAWNYHIGAGSDPRVTVTYWMNQLQSLKTPEQFFVTLNRTEAIRPETVLGRWNYHHPIYTPRAVRAQREHARINGRAHAHFCGAYWGFGFHEDGVRSAHQACAGLLEPAAELVTA